MQWLRTHRATVMFLLCTAVIALRLMWLPLDRWLGRLLFVVLFPAHRPEIIKYFEYSH